MIRDADERVPGQGGAKVLRVMLPVECHVQLHHAKLMTGKSKAQMVEEAVQRYLDDLKLPRQRRDEDSPTTH